MQVTATQAKNRFGAICAQAKIEPVYVEKDGRIDTVILSAQHFEAMRAAGQREPLEQRRQAFEQRYKKWFDEQKAIFDEHGLWCDDLRIW